MSQEKLSTVLKWAAGFVGAVLISPYVFLAVQGLVGLILALAIGFAAIQLAPWFGTFVSNLAMKAFVSEVGANPIESLKNLYVEKMEELGKMREDIVQFDGELGVFKKQIKKVKAEYPEEAAEYDQYAADEEAALQQMKDLYETARQEVEGLQKDINKAETLYNLALGALRVSKLSKSQKSQVYAEIKKKVAFDAVDRKVNMSFAALRGSVDNRKTRSLQLPASSVETSPLATTKKVLGSAQ